jgi:hypothetical protein
MKKFRLGYLVTIGVLLIVNVSFAAFPDHMHIGDIIGYYTGAGGGNIIINSAAGSLSFTGATSATISSATDLTLNPGVNDVSLSDVDLKNVQDIALDSLSPDGTNISVTIGAGTLGIGDGAYTWGHSPGLGVEVVAEFDAATYHDGDLYVNDILSSATVDVEINPGTYGNFLLTTADSVSSALFGPVSYRGAATDMISNGTATLTKNPHSIAGIVAGDVVHITDATTTADEGYYIVASTTSSTIVLTEALSGSDSDVDVKVYGGVYNMIGGFDLKNSETTPVSVAYRNRIFAPPYNTATENSAMYCNLNHRAANLTDNINCLYMENDADQSQTGGSLIKIIQRGNGDAVYVALMGNASALGSGSGYGYEAAMFGGLHSDGTSDKQENGFLGSFQGSGGFTESRKKQSNSIPFHALVHDDGVNPTTPDLWATNYGLFYANNSLANAFRVRVSQYAQNYPQFHISDSSLRSVWAAYGDGTTYIDGEASTGGDTYHPSPEFRLRGTYWSGSASTYQDTVLKTFVSSGGVPSLYVYTGATGAPTLVTTFNATGQSLQNHTLIEVGGITMYSGGTGIDLQTKGIVNADNVQLNSISASTANININSGAGITQIGDGTYSWSHSPNFGIEGISEFDSELYFDDRFITNPVVTVADGDTTPSIASGNVFITSSNTGATAITDLDDAVAGQFVLLIGGSNTNSSTIADSGNFNLNNMYGSFTAKLDSSILLYVQADNDYIEVARTIMGTSGYVLSETSISLSNTWTLSSNGFDLQSGLTLGSAGSMHVDCADNAVGGTPATCTMVSVCPGGASMRTCIGIDWECLDADGCIITLSETSAGANQVIKVGNTSTYPLFLVDSGGVGELPNTLVLYQWDNVMLRYIGSTATPDRWMAISTSINSGPLQITIADGGGGATAYTLNAYKDKVELTCSDTDSCTITLAETYITDGREVVIVNAGANVVTFADTAGVTELDGPMSMSQYESLSLLYVVDRWVETARSKTAMVGVERRLASVASIDLNNAAKQTLYTVPVASTAVVTKVIVRNASADISSAVAGFGGDTPADDFLALQDLTGLTAATDAIWLVPASGTVFQVYAAGAVFGIDVTTQEATADTVTVDVFGYLL